MLKNMLCGLVVMTASCFGMQETDTTQSSNQALLPAFRVCCTNSRCLGQLPGLNGCAKVGKEHLQVPHDPRMVSWKTLSQKRDLGVVELSKKEKSDAENAGRTN